MIICTLLIVTGGLLSAQSVWEGVASMARYGEFPASGYYASSNTFPRNSIVEVESKENGNSITLVVTDRMDQGGNIMLLLSQDAAEALGIGPKEVARVKANITIPATAYTEKELEDQPYHPDPDINPAAEGEETESLTYVPPLEDEEKEEQQEKEKQPLPKVEPEPKQEPKQEPKKEPEISPEEEPEVKTPEPVIVLGEDLPEAEEPKKPEEPKVDEEGAREYAEKAAEPGMAWAEEDQPPEKPEIDESLPTPELEKDKDHAMVEPDIPEEEEKVAEETKETEETEEKGPKVTGNGVEPEKEVPEDAELALEPAEPKPPKDFTPKAAEEVPEEKGTPPLDDVMDTDKLAKEPELKPEKPQAEMAEKEEAEEEEKDEKPVEEKGPRVTSADVDEPTEEEIPEEEALEEAGEPDLKEEPKEEPKAKIPEVVKKPDVPKGQDLYYLQIGAYTEEPSAKAAQKKVSLTYPTRIYPEKRGKGMYKVLVGPITEDETGSVLFDLKARGYSDAFLRKSRDFN